MGTPTGEIPHLLTPPLQMTSAPHTGKNRLPVILITYTYIYISSPQGKSDASGHPSILYSNLSRLGPQQGCILSRHMNTLIANIQKAVVGINIWHSLTAYCDSRGLTLHFSSLLVLFSSLKFTSDGKPWLFTGHFRRKGFPGRFTKEDLHLDCKYQIHWWKILQIATNFIFTHNSV